MATPSTPLPGARVCNGARGVLLAGGILFLLGFAGSSVLLGSECGTGGRGATGQHGRA